MDDLEKRILSSILTNRLFYGDPKLFIQEYQKQLKQDKGRFRPYFLESPQAAYWFAKIIDEKPRDDTRTASCAHGFWAYFYALNVDKKPCEETKKAANTSELWAAWYSEWVEK